MGYKQQGAKKPGSLLVTLLFLNTNNPVFLHPAKIIWNTPSKKNLDHKKKYKSKKQVNPLCKQLLLNCLEAEIV